MRYLQAPLEDAEGVAGGEGARRVPQPQGARLAVCGLVDVGMRLELVARVCAARCGDADESRVR
jgi:hypothetical protein